MSRRNALQIRSISCGGKDDCTETIVFSILEVVGIDIAFSTRVSLVCLVLLLLSSLVCLTYHVTYLLTYHFGCRSTVIYRLGATGRGRGRGCNCGCGKSSVFLPCIVCSIFRIRLSIRVSLPLSAKYTIAKHIQKTTISTRQGSQKFILFPFASFLLSLVYLHGTVNNVLTLCSACRRLF